MLYVLKKEQVEHARLRALAQAIIAKDKAKEVFDDYMKIAFPWVETQKSRDKEDHIKILMHEVEKGALGIKPLWQESQMRSRMKTKIVEKENGKPETGRSREAMNALYAKLGKSIPV
jgi:hypothetical protein